jgi:hypothetical protein
MTSAAAGGLAAWTTCIRAFSKGKKKGVTADDAVKRHEDFQMIATDAMRRAQFTFSQELKHPYFLLRRSNATPLPQWQ